MIEKKRVAVIVAPALVAIFLTLLAVSALTRTPQPATAAPPFVQDAVGAFGGSIAYGAAAGLTPSIAAPAAVASARKFTDASTVAVVHSAGLALYSDPKSKNVLVWVVDLDGLNMPAVSGGFANGQAASSRVITRAVILVSATEADSIVGLFASGNPGN
jgi:hypothetical protein